MQSQLGSKLKMGGAVINGYCESDMSPEFVGAYSETGVVNGGVVNEVTVVLKNVKTTCVDNVGTAPCATDAGKDRWPAFVCSFTAAGVTTTAAPVQGLRVEDVSQSGQVMGIGAFVKCEMPARENADHDVTVSLAYHGKTVVAVPFTGKTGADIVSISSTASPTDSPTLYPTAAPTLSPTAEPTGTSGCSTVVNLASYYRDCSASSTKPSQFFTAHLEAGYEGTCGHAQFTFCNRRAAVDRTELRTFSCANSRAGIKGVTFGGTRFAFYTYFGAAANNAPIRKIMEPGQGNRQYLTFETDHQGSGNAWLEWDFTEPVVVTKVHWTWSPLSTGGEMSSRSGGVAVTGSNGGTGMVGSGAEQQRDVDWGNDCVDCPKGGAIKFSAIDGNLGDSPGSWSVQDIEVWGCTKSDSKHIDGWDHGDSNMRNGVCPSGYQDEDGDLVCARCTTAGDCGPGSEFDDSHCSTAKDNTCTSCEKPERSKFGNRDGTLSSGSCSFVCTDGFTGDQCQFSNVCADTTVVLGDATATVGTGLKPTSMPTPDSTNGRLLRLPLGSMERKPTRTMLTTRSSP